jgi:hypothetical protein
MLTVDESRDGVEGQTATGFGHGRRRGFGQRRWHGRDRARRGEAVRTAAAARSERRCRDAGARS